MSLTLGLDIGTSSVKATVLTDDGAVHVGAVAIDLLTDAPGRAEACPQQWLEAIAPAIRTACAGVGARPGDVAGVAVTGMVPAVVLSDAAGRPVRLAILQSDARAGAEVAQLRTLLGDEAALATAGSVVSQQWVGPTLLWLAREEPETFARVRRVEGSYDFVARALGARAHVERNWAVESGLFRLDEAPWGAARTAAGVDDALVPEPAAPGDVVGSVDAAGSTLSGLRPGTPIVVGGADHVAAAYAAGCVRPGDWLVKLGSAGDILAVADRPVRDRRLYLDHHQVPGMWLPNGCMASTGNLLAWLRELTGRDLATVEQEAAAARPGGLLCLPYFLGEKSPLHDPDLRGAILGLHLGVTAGDLYRAALEGTALAYRRHVEIFAEVGVPLAVGRITNGGSRSTLWKQIVADALGRPLTTLRHSGGAGLGAATTAAVGIGAARWEDITGLVSIEGTVEPSAPDGLYDERYAQLLELTATLAEPLHALAARQTRDLRSLV